MTNCYKNCIICGKEISEKRIIQGKITCSKSCAMKLHYSNPDARQRQSEKIKSIMTKDVRQKIADSTTKLWQTEAYRESHVKAAKIAHQNEELNKKISNSLKAYYNDSSIKENCSTRLRQRYLDDNYKRKHTLAITNETTIIKRVASLKETYKNEEVKKRHRDSVSAGVRRAYKEKQHSILQKRYNTMKQNNSFGKSSLENNTYELLLIKFSKEDIQCQYFDKERYPFKCDFYIKSLDLFIECHYGWTHGIRQCHEPFDSSSKKHIEILNDLEEKAKTSKFYKNAIYQWTDLDVRKRQCAKNNKLNWIAFYNYEDFEKWLSQKKY